MEKPEVRAEVKRYYEELAPENYQVEVFIVGTGWQKNLTCLTEVNSKLIADHINADPAEIEARLRRKLWEEVSRLELVPDNTAGYTGPTMRARYDERTLKAVLEIMEGDSK